MTFRIPIDPTAGVSPSLNSKWRTLWSGTYRPQAGEPTTAVVSATAYAGDATVGQIRVVVPGTAVASDPVIVSAQQPVTSHVVALVECGVADTPILIEGRRVSGDEGVWIVEAAAVALSATASEILPGPRIGLQPEDVSAPSGSTATVTVGAEGVASASGQEGLLYRLMECPSKAVVEEQTSAGLVEFDIARGEGSYSYQIQVLSDYGVVLSREFSVIFEQVPATITQLVGPSSWYLGQPETPGDLVASVTGSAPVMVSWERRFASGLWETVGQDTQVVGGLATLSLDPVAELGMYEWRATASNAAGTDAQVHVADVVEPNGAAVLSWASADFNLGDVLAPDEIRWLTSVGDTQQSDDRLVRFFGTFEAPSGTEAVLQRSLDQLTWVNITPPYGSPGDPISVSIDYTVDEGVSYWRWVADPDGEAVASPVATVTLTLTADSEPPVLTVDPIASGPGPILVTGTVTDNVVVAYTSVRFSQNGGPPTGISVVVDGDTWSAEWNPAAGGHSGGGFVATAYAHDAVGNEVYTDSNTFAVTASDGSDVTPPTSTIDAVSSGSGVFSLSGTSIDAESGVAEVLIKMWSYNGVQIGPPAGVIATLSGDNWTADFDPSPHIGSGVVATVVATDAAGNEAPQIVSNSFNVTSPPPPAGSFGFDDGQVGVGGDAHARNAWFWEYNRSYFEPTHSLLNASPQRVIYASSLGTGNGLTPGTPTSLRRYMTHNGVTPTPGDQVRLFPGDHQSCTTTEIQAHNVQGTAAAPIRFVRHDPNIAPRVFNPQQYDSTWGFSDDFYIGLHGIEIDGASANTWGLTFGRRHSFNQGDTGMERCHHIDVWHCDIHHMDQTVCKIGGTQGNEGGTTLGALGKSYDAHLYGNHFHHSDQGTNTFSELLYTGDGNTDGGEGSYGADYVNDVIVESCHFSDGPSGEAVDFKFFQTGSQVVGCYVHGIRANSQGAIVAQNSFLTVSKTVVHDARRKDSNSYDVSAVFCPNGLIEDLVCWDLSASAVGYPNKLAAGTLTVNRVTVWDASIDYGNDSMLLLHASSAVGQQQYHEDGSGTPTVIVTDCVSGDGSYSGGGATNGSHTYGVSYTAHDASASDFVGPIVGTAEAIAGRPGSGFQLAVSSAIPSGAGAQGLGDATPPPAGGGGGGSNPAPSGSIDLGGWTVAAALDLTLTTGTTYYVDPDSGSNSNDGLSQGAAWQTLQHGINQTQSVSPRPLIRHKPGTFVDPPVVETKGHGSAGNWATITSYDDVNLVHYQYVTPSTVANKYSFFMPNGSSYWQIGLFHLDATAVQLSGTYSGWERGMVALNYLSSGTPDSHHFRMVNNIVEGFPIGINAINTNQVLAQGNICRDNAKFYNEGGSGISFDSLLEQSSTDWVYSYGGINYGVAVLGNICYDNVQTVPSSGLGQPNWATDGNGVIFGDNSGGNRLAGGVFLHPTLFANNLCFGNGGRGVNIFATSNCDVFGNTTYGNGINQELINDGLVSYNNAFPVAEFGAYDSPNMRFHNNVAWLTQSPNDDVFNTDVTDPAPNTTFTSGGSNILFGPVGHSFAGDRNTSPGLASPTRVAGVYDAGFRPTAGAAAASGADSSKWGAAFDLTGAARTSSVGAYAV